MPVVVRSSEATVIARGKHLSDSVGACSTADCHGADLGGGKTIAMGPLGTISSPNLTATLADYSDGELARVVRHGIKKNGRSVILMPSHEFGWLSLEDTGALVSYLRTVPPVNRASGPLKVGILGKVLDRQENIIFDVARHIDHAARAKESPPPAGPTAEYGAFLGKNCLGCHGEGLSGGPIPGAPSDMAVPKNITPHETGLKSWSFEDFEKMCASGVNKDGRKLDAMMPYEALSKLDEVEKKALWAYLRSVQPKPFGGR